MFSGDKDTVKFRIIQIIREKIEVFPLFSVDFEAKSKVELGILQENHK